MDKEVYSLILQRWEVIESLRNESKDKRTLVEHLDCSRSTVNRAVRELESVGVVEYVDGEYIVTSFGQVITDGFDELMTTVDLRIELEPFLQWMPDDTFDLQLRHLRDAELVLPESGNPYAMINRHVRVIEQSGSHQCVLPVVGLLGHKAVHKQIVNNGATSETIAAPDALDTLQSNSAYADLTEEMVATGRFQLFQYTDSIPYFIGIFDDIVQIGVDEKGEPRALLESENAEVKKWALNQFEEYKKEAEPITFTADTTKSQL